MLHYSILFIVGINYAMWRYVDSIVSTIGAHKGSPTSEELFKKTLPGASASFMQMQVSAAHQKSKALALIADAKRKAGKPRAELDFLALAVQGKKVNFAKVIKMSLHRSFNRNKIANRIAKYNKYKHLSMCISIYIDILILWSIYTYT